MTPSVCLMIRIAAGEAEIWKIGVVGGTVWKSETA